MNKLALMAALALVMGLTFYPIAGKAQTYGGYGYEYEYGSQYQQPQKSLDQQGAKTILENYLESTRNHNLKLGKLEDKGNAFEGEILTQEGSLVDKISVDKNTGRMRSVLRQHF